MCGWGAGGESGPGAGCGMGRHGGMSWGIGSGGWVLGVCTGRPGSVPVGAGWGVHTGQQPQIEPGRRPEGSDLGGNQICQSKGDSPEGLEVLSKRLREAFISIIPDTPQRSFLCIVRY